MLQILCGKILFLLDWDGGSAEEPENCYDHKESVDIGCTPENGIWWFGEVSEGSKGIYGYYRIYDSYTGKYDYETIVCNQYAKWSRFEQNMDPNLRTAPKLTNRRAIRESGGVANRGGERLRGDSGDYLFLK